MRLINRLLALLALSGVIFLLLTGSASAAVDFPADEAGISAYVKAKSSVPNLNAAVPAFATIERQTADYIIGTVAMDYHREEQYPHVYVSTDGWVVAYYPNDRSSGWLLPWYYYGGGAISTTTLKEAAQIVCDQIGGTTTGLKYYDFRHPEATKMMIVVESYGTSGGEWFKVTIPSSYTVYRVDWSHFENANEWGFAYLDGTEFSRVYWNYNANHANYGSFDPSTEFPNGIEHEVELTRNGGWTRVGLVLEYAE